MLDFQLNSIKNQAFKIKNQNPIPVFTVSLKIKFI